MGSLKIQNISKWKKTVYLTMRTTENNCEQKQKAYNWKQHSDNGHA